MLILYFCYRYHHEPYTENRVLTPSVYRKLVADPLSPRRDFSTQTGKTLVSVASSEGEELKCKCSVYSW